MSTNVSILVFVLGWALLWLGIGIHAGRISRKRIRQYDHWKIWDAGWRAAEKQFDPMRREKQRI